MTMLDPGYSEAAASLFIWVADKTLGGVKKALGWSWDQVAWAKAQDRYDAEIIRQHGTIRIFGQTTPKPLREIYTDVFVLDTPTAHRRFGPEQLAVHLWNEERGLPFRHAERKPGIGLLDSGTQFFLLGKPGAGKTTFLKYLAVREARRGAWGRSLGKLPIFVPLRQYADAGKSLFDFIVDQFDVCHFPGNAAPFVDALLASGKALVLFDGLDEVAKSDAEDRRGARAHALVPAPHDIFQNHDGVVDDQSGRKNEREQGEDVYREACEIDRRNRADQCHRHCEARDEGRTPVEQENEDDKQHDADGQHERDFDLMHCPVDENRIVACDLDGHSLGKLRLKLRDSCSDALRDIERIGFGRSYDANPDTGLPV